MNIGLAIQKTIRTLLLTLCEFVYSMIVFFFNVFEAIGTAEIVKDTYIMDVYERVGLILGLFMIFRITFSTIQYVINPDLLSDKKTGFGNVIKKAFLVVVLLGTTPYIFDAAFEVQNIVIEKNVLPKLIVGATGDVDDFGINLVEFTFFNFYKRNENATSEVCSETEYNSIKKVFHNTGDLNATRNCVERYDEANNEWAINFDYHGLLPLIVGVLILWIIVMYTIQVAVRAFQLAYLQLIAPIPIMLYLDPKKDDQLMKWGKQCLTTYLDLFIRVGIIYFVVFIIEMIRSEDFLNGIYVSGGFFPNFYVQLILVIALLIFAKKVPDLFKELFPMSGGAAKFDFGMKAPKEAKQVFGTLAGAATGAAVGLIGGPGVGGRIKGVFGGLTKGAISGAKGKKVSEVASARAAQNIKNRQIKNSDSTFAGRLDASFRDKMGLETRTELIDKDIKAIDKENERIDNTEIRTRRDRIASINNGRMREINDKIDEIRNGDEYKKKASNDQIISARNAILDKAKEELTKSNAAVIGASARLDYLSSHHGEVDKLTGNLIDGTMISDQKASLKQIIENESEAWITANMNTDETVLKNRQIIASQTGVDIGDVSDFQSIKTSYERAKNSNTTLAVDIQQKEYEIQTLNEEKRILEGNVEIINREISQFEQQKDSNNRRKEVLEKSKKKPQANQDAIKKK